MKTIKNGRLRTTYKADLQ